MKFDVKVDVTVGEVHVHHHSDEQVQAMFGIIQTQLTELKAQGNKLMALVDDLKTAIAELDAETTNVATRIDALIAKLTSQSLTPEQKTEVLAQLAGETARLKTLAADPIIVVPPSGP